MRYGWFLFLLIGSISINSCKKNEEALSPLICSVQFADATLNAQRKTIDCVLEKKVTSTSECDQEDFCLIAEPDEILIILGSNLETTKKVFINNFPCQIISGTINNKSVQFKLPSEFSSGKISIETDLGKTFSITDVQLLETPKISQISALKGVPGDIIRVFGSSFNENTFNGLWLGSCDLISDNAAPIASKNGWQKITSTTIMSDTEMRFIVPELNLSNFCLAIEVNGVLFPFSGESSVFQLSLPPEIISFDPSSVVLDVTEIPEVIIRGQNLDEVNEVSLNNVPMDIDKTASSDIRMTLRFRQSNIDDYRTGVFVLKNSNFLVPTTEFIVNNRNLLLDFDGNGDLDAEIQNPNKFEVSIDGVKLLPSIVPDVSIQQKQQVAVLTSQITAGDPDGGFWQISAGEIGNNNFITTGINSSRPSLVDLKLSLNNFETEDTKLKVILEIEIEQVEKQPPRKILRYESLVENILPNQWNQYNLNFSDFVNLNGETDIERESKPDINKIKLLKLIPLAVDPSSNKVIRIGIDEVILQGAIF